MNSANQSSNPWLSIDPAQLRHQVTIQAQNPAQQDEFGQPFLLWKPVRTCYGGLNLVSMRQAFGEGQLTAQETDIWTVRWSPVEIQPGMQLVFGGLTYRIELVNNVARRNITVHLLTLLLNAQS